MKTQEKIYFLGVNIPSTTIESVQLPDNTSKFITVKLKKDVENVNDLMCEIDDYNPRQFVIKVISKKEELSCMDMHCERIMMNHEESAKTQQITMTVEVRNFKTFEMTESEWNDSI